MLVSYLSWLEVAAVRVTFEKHVARSNESKQYMAQSFLGSSLHRNSYTKCVRTPITRWEDHVN